jgi:hypothetical protein
LRTQSSLTLSLNAVTFRLLRIEVVDTHDGVLKAIGDHVVTIRIVDEVGFVCQAIRDLIQAFTDVVRDTRWFFPTIFGFTYSFLVLDQTTLKKAYHDNR